MSTLLEQMAKEQGAPMPPKFPECTEKRDPADMATIVFLVFVVSLPLIYGILKWVR